MGRVDNHAVLERCSWSDVLHVLAVHSQGRRIRFRVGRNEEWADAVAITPAELVEGVAIRVEGIEHPDVMAALLELHDLCLVTVNLPSAVKLYAAAGRMRRAIGAGPPHDYSGHLIVIVHPRGPTPSGRRGCRL